MHANVTWLPLVSASASVSVQPSVIMLLMKQPANGRAEHLQPSPGTALDQIKSRPHPRLFRLMRMSDYRRLELASHRPTCGASGGANRLRTSPSAKPGSAA
ncbi:hypothetical protein H0G86_006813 [Trichoderma simmonsii]|uniref:Uncharacterized protein n=1 Tax=Trichoderma simmonsii TaxID=1491479 RepID=A0A8G0LGX2_9HYPO|nr:hypothetical protein H0G86_006813 [Trichoderma simmonsii]